MTRLHFILDMVLTTVIASSVTYVATVNHVRKEQSAQTIINTKPDTQYRNVHSEPSVCRVFITQDGMIDITSPSGTVDVFSDSNNLVFDEDELSDDEGE